MVEKIVDYIVAIQISSGKIKQEEDSVYRYGYTLLLEKMTNIFITILICIISHEWIKIWMFLLLIIPLRSFTGGWHANKFWQCTIISNLIVILMLITIDNILIENKIIYVLVEVIVLFVMLYIIPVQNTNKPLNTKELKKYKKISFFIWLAECCFMLILVGYKNYTYSTLILYAHTVTIVAVIGGKVSNMKYIKRNNRKAIY